MKRYIIIAITAAFIAMNGCDSDSSNSSECTNGDVKADCNDGKYSKCVDGKWTETVCDNNASCNAQNKCGECTNGDVNADCNEGKYSKCVDGKWTETACDNNASCNAENKCGECKDGDDKADCNEGNITKCVHGKWTASECEGDVSCAEDGKCGVCKNGDTTKCTNDSMGVGSALVCKNGKWSDSAEKCLDMFSCSMKDECYRCYIENCNRFTCNDDCKDTTCKVECDNYTVCIKQCEDKNNGCDSKCGECVNRDHINCVEDNNGVGSADICSNGKWASNRECKIVQGFDVSCHKRCNNLDGCNEDEYVSVCGDCKNSADRICIGKNNPYNVVPEHEWDLVLCIEGMFDFDHQVPCPESCTTQDKREACLQNVEPNP